MSFVEIDDLRLVIDKAMIMLLDGLDGFESTTGVRGKAAGEADPYIDVVFRIAENRFESKPLAALPQVCLKRRYVSSTTPLVNLSTNCASTSIPERSGSVRLSPTYAETMLAWMDLEMTGLDPDQDTILEIATLITDDNLELIAEGPDLIIHASEEDLTGMDDVVVKMHTRSGLLSEVRESTVSLPKREHRLWPF